MNMNATTGTEVLDHKVASHKITRLKGRLDAASVDKKKAALTRRIAGDSCSVVLNIRDVEFIDSTGLGFLVSLQQQVKAQGNQLVICEPTDQAQVLFELTRLNQIFDIYDSETAALNVI